jgi:hypothetical protein
MRNYFYKRAAFRSDYVPRGQSMKPIEVGNRDRRKAAELGSRALLNALHLYFLKGGRA